MTQRPGFVVRMDVYQEGDHFYAKCEQVPGVHVGGFSREEALESARLALKVLMKANNGLEVEVSPIVESLEAFTSPVGIPDRFVVQPIAT